MSVAPLRITLIGVGLIGGSFVLDLKRHKLAAHIVGIDTDRANLDRALERHVIDTADTQIRPEYAAESDLVLIATPVAALGTICARLAPHIGAQTIISDVGSTKQSALAAFRLHLPQHFAQCVAAHPIAGSDRSGATAARFDLFRNKKLIVCPHAEQDSGSLKTVEYLWQAVGAHTYRMEAAEHDAVFAAVSHFPHLLAFAYVHQMLDHPNGEQYLHFAGSGFRDFTRIAASNPHMWKDIMLENRQAMLALIEDQKRQLDYLSDCLNRQDAAVLAAYFGEARDVREAWGQAQEN